MLAALVTAGCSGSSAGSHSNLTAAVETQLRSAGGNVISSEQRATQAICAQRASLRVDARGLALDGGPRNEHPHLTVWLPRNPRTATRCEHEIGGFPSLPTTQPLRVRPLSGQVQFVDRAGAYVLVATAAGGPRALIGPVARAASRLRNL